MLYLTSSTVFRDKFNLYSYNEGFFLLLVFDMSIKSTSLIFTNISSFRHYDGKCSLSHFIYFFFIVNKPKNIVNNRWSHNWILSNLSWRKTMYQNREFITKAIGVHLMQYVHISILCFMHQLKKLSTKWFVNPYWQWWICVNLVAMVTVNTCQTSSVIYHLLGTRTMWVREEEDEVFIRVL